jgi:succinylglutamate desuccinylase
MKQVELPEGMFIKRGKGAGKTVAIFGGVHGNEKVGIKMIDILRKNLKIEAGTVYLVYGNPEAIKQNKRFVEKNLNRCFKKDSQGKTIEDKRARELMRVMDRCDALLDLHSFTNPNGAPFIICEKDEFKIIKNFSLEIITYNWEKLSGSLSGSTAAYMKKQKKLAIGIECGSHKKIKIGLKNATDAVDNFLTFFKLLKSGANLSAGLQNNTKRYIKIKKVIIRKNKDFKFSREYNNFDKLKEGEIFAREDNKKLIAKKNECIVLPTPNEPIGGEICILGKEIKDFNDNCR